MILARSQLRVARRAPETPFFDVEQAPPDPILGLGVAFSADRNPQKVDLGVGVYKDASGRCPVFRSVSEASLRAHDDGEPKVYLPVAGLSAFVDAARDLLFPAQQGFSSQEVATVQTLGGTGALRLAAELCAHARPGARVWVTDPTWPNHAKICMQGGLEVLSLPYLDPTARRVHISRLLDGLDRLGPDNVVILHGCCHNPTGLDPDVDAWSEIASVARRRRWLPLVDVAYSGFGEGLDEDLRGVRMLASAEIPMLVAFSFSKILGLYGERVGALHAVSGGSAVAVKSQLERLIRSSYSSPPTLGARIAAEVLKDAALKRQWMKDLGEARDRVRKMRRSLTEALQTRVPDGDFSLLNRQRGMFGLVGLLKEDIRQLREKFSIYLPDSGRVNFAGLVEGNVERVADGLAEVFRA